MKRALVTASLLLVVLIAPASSPAAYRVGISDQHAEMFGSQLFQDLRVREARLVVPWDALKVGFDRQSVDAWLASAKATRTRPLVSFSHSRVKPRKLPSVREYKRAFQAFRKRYPWVKTFSPWNEANHQSQPTFHRPQWAARYYNVVRAGCRGCTIVALDVLDQPGMIQYVKAFRHSAKGSPHIWGLHNYRDANRYRNKGTKALLRAVRGTVWLTETGGIVRFATRWPYNEKRAAKVTKYMFRLARSNSRIKRLYIYSWLGEKRGARFDAGLVGPTGKARPAYYVVKNKLKNLHR
jgi:hypothetical protein